MKRFLCCFFAATFSATIALGQETKEAVPVISVCEVLADVSRYDDAVLALVGRIESSVSLIDHSVYLSQDSCEHPLITHGNVWLSRIQIWGQREEGLPKPPGEKPKLDHAAIARKLSMIRKTTKLDSHQEPTFKRDGDRIAFSGFRSAPNEWALAYGRIRQVPDLFTDCGPGGCGGDNVPLVILVEPYNVIRVTEDGTPLPSGK
jgi:hypothetical protein